MLWNIDNTGEEHVMHSQVCLKGGPRKKNKKTLWESLYLSFAVTRSKIELIEKIPKITLISRQ